MYRLKTSKNTCNFLKNSSAQKTEKSGKNIYLKNSQWTALDRLSDEKGVSRNQVIRDILDEFLEVE